MQIKQQPRQHAQITPQTIADYFGVSYATIKKYGKKLNGGLKNTDNLFEIMLLLFQKKGGLNSRGKVITPQIIADYFGVSTRTIQRKAQKQGKSLDDIDFLFQLIFFLKDKHN